MLATKELLSTVRRPGSVGCSSARSSECSEAGFSLVELMISVVILAIAMALAMPSFSQWIQNTHIRGAAESLLNGIQRARAEAVTRNVSVTFSVAGDNFWTITDTALNQVIESRPRSEIPASVTITVSPAPVPPATAPTTLTFNNLGIRIANADASVPIETIDIDSSALDEDDSRNLRIIIGAGGIARMCDPNPAIEETDPRHCPE